MTHATATWKDVYHQRCPCCRQANIFRPDRRMWDQCPRCQVRFEREPGYFLGAMYFSYAGACLFLIALMGLGLWLLPNVNSMWIALVVIALFLPFAPGLARYARVMWMYFDHWAWPDDPGSDELRP